MRPRSTIVSLADPDAGAPRAWREAVIEAVIRACGLSAIGIVALIFLFLLREGLAAFAVVPVRDCLGTRWYPIEALYGIAPLVYGSILVTLRGVGGHHRAARAHRGRLSR